MKIKSDERWTHSFMGEFLGISLLITGTSILIINVNAVEWVNAYFILGNVLNILGIIIGWMGLTGWLRRKREGRKQKKRVETRFEGDTFLTT